MAKTGRTALFTIVSLVLGFVCGVWLVGTGIVFRFMGAPQVESANAIVISPKSSMGMPVIPPEKAVAVPESYKIGSGSAGLFEVSDRMDLQPSAGCEWVVLPRSLRLDHSWQSSDWKRILVGSTSIESESGSLRYLLVQMAKPGVPELSLRPVFFDEDANRKVPDDAGWHSFSGREGRQESSLAVREFRLAPVQQGPPTKVAYVGIERIPTDAEKQRVEAAQREAKDKKIPILPAPRFGEPYRFDLPTTDGKRVRSEDLRGKAVMFVVIGPGPGNSLTLVSVRSALRSTRNDELVVVGVSFQATADDVQIAFDEAEIEGPLVFVPNDPATRKLWTEGAELAYVPNILLVDRDGVLRFRCTTIELQDRVDMLFGRRKRFPRPTTPKPAPVLISPPPLRPGI